MPYKAGDRVAEVSLDCLQVCAGRGRNHFSTISKDFTIHAKQFEWGFHVYLRKNFKSKTVIFKVYTGTRKLRREHLALKCASCHKFPRRAYLDWDSLTGLCKYCYQIPKDYQYPRPSMWMNSEYLMFQRLFKKRIAVLVAGVTIKNMRSMEAEAFFAAHPYLVPPFFETIARYDTKLYEKSLRHLLGIYKRRIYLWKVPKLTEEENDWLDRHLAVKLSMEYGTLKGESEWLKQNLEPLKNHRGSASAGESSPPGSREANGSLSGTPSALSRLPGSETDSSLSKTSSNLAMSAEPAMEPGRSTANNVQEKAFMSAKDETSNVPLAEGKASSNVRSVVAREDYSLSRNSLSGARLPEESSQLVTK